jgi:hypothetical protein
MRKCEKRRGGIERGIDVKKRNTHKKNMLRGLCQISLDRKYKKRSRTNTDTSL